MKKKNVGILAGIVVVLGIIGAAASLPNGNQIVQADQKSSSSYSSSSSSSSSSASKTKENSPDWLTKTESSSHSSTPKTPSSSQVQTPKAPSSEAQASKAPSSEAQTPKVQTPVQPEKQSTVVYITETGEKYHSYGCQYLRKSCIEIELSRAKLSYSPCSKCHPPQ